MMQHRQYATAMHAYTDNYNIFVCNEDILKKIIKIWLMIISQAIRQAGDINMIDSTHRRIVKNSNFPGASLDLKWMNFLNLIEYSIHSIML